MARARNIKPGFFANEILAECEPLARILFAGLWCIADRAGRMEDRPKRIRAELLPYDHCDADRLLEQLEEHGFILRYEVCGNRYIQVLNFGKHQNPHIKESASSIPAPCQNDERQEQEQDKHSASTVQAQCENSTNPADSLIPDSLIPDSKTHTPSAAADDVKSSRSKTLKATDLVALGVNKQAADDYLALRKAKRAPLTKTALEAIVREGSAAGLNLDTTVRLMVERNWQGFKAEWLQRDQPPARTARVNDMPTHYGESGVL